MVFIPTANNGAYLVQYYDEFEENWRDFNYYSTLAEAEDALKDYFKEYAETNIDYFDVKMSMEARIFHVLDYFEVKAEAEAKIHLTTITKRTSH